MPLCTSRSCGCSLTSATLAISGDGTAATPWSIDIPGNSAQLPYFTFANATARDLALPAPAEGQECWLQAENQRTRYFGGWRVVYQPLTDYTPTFSGVTLGAGTPWGEYSRSDDMVYYWGYLAWGAGTDFFDFVHASIPVPADAKLVARRGGGTVGFYDAATNRTYAGMIDVQTDARIYTGNGVPYNPTNTSPFTWSNGSQFWWAVSYPAA